jgi:hypothetical protein
LSDNHNDIVRGKKKVYFNHISNNISSGLEVLGIPNYYIVRNNFEWRKSRDIRVKILVAPALTIYTYYIVDSQVFFKKNTTFVSSADRKKMNCIYGFST